MRRPLTVTQRPLCPRRTAIVPADKGLIQHILSPRGSAAETVDATQAGTHPFSTQATHPQLVCLSRPISPLFTVQPATASKGAAEQKPGEASRSGI